MTKGFNHGDEDLEDVERLVRGCVWSCAGAIIAIIAAVGLVLWVLS